MIRRSTLRERKRRVLSTKLILGKATEDKPFGFICPTQASRNSRLVTYDGPAHLLTVAPTRAGKGTDVIIPNLLNYVGSAVVFDPKGELYAVTHRYRQMLGQRVHLLDPFKTIKEKSDSLNSFDLLRLPGTDLEIDSRVLSEIITRGNNGFKEPFWDLSGTAFNTGLTAYFASHSDPAKRNLPALIDLLFSDDTVYNCAVALDTQGKAMPKSAYREIGTVLQMPELTRGGVIATSQSYLRALNTEAVLDSLRVSTINLEDFVAGVPMTIYIVIPPHRLIAYRSLLRLWMGTLVAAVKLRKQLPQSNTLFLLDEMGQLENFPLLETMLTLCAGYGVTVWGFLQDLAQLQTCYPTSWKTILNNCGVIQAFGFNNRAMATQWSEYFDHGPNQLRSLGHDEQVLAIKGQDERISRRVNYLKNKRYQGCFDSNPFYANRNVNWMGHSEPAENQQSL